MDYLPIFLDLRGRRVVVVGGGRVAARKVELLLRAGASVRIIASNLCEELKNLSVAGRIRHAARDFDAADLDGAALIIAATDQAQTNAEVSRLANLRSVPVNVVDKLELCSFILPAVIDRSPVVAAVSSSGTAPVLTRLLRARLESVIPSTYGRLAEFAQRYRERVKQRFSTAARRRRFWEDVLDGPIAERVFSGQQAEAERQMEAALSEQGGNIVGEVYLVGAGPGDPDLLTLRALRLMQQADVVLYDRLVSPQVLNLVRREAERVYVGKRRAFHTVRQEEINRMIVQLAREGKRVLRLKGGDPLIFGRGGEEIGSLAAEGIPFQIVPGITAALGCASYAGIPLTHRDYAHSVVFATGHLHDGQLHLNWEGLVAPQQTIVIYMGLTGLATLCAALVEHGLVPETPAALVERGTTAEQRVISGTLATLPGLVADGKVHAPTLLIVGRVVTLREKLAWFDGQQSAGSRRSGD